MIPRRKVVVLAILVAATLPLAANAQSGAVVSPELAARLLRAAQDLERDGQVEPARQTFRQLLESDPAGPCAADALLGLARLAWPVADPDDLGAKPVDADALVEAKDKLDTLLKKFPAAPAAPEALWRLALLRLEPGSLLWDQEQGLAHLTTLLRVHPDSPRSPQALALAAELHIEANRIGRARGLAFRLLADWPDHAAAARGWLALAAADAREEKLEDALVELGRARAAGQGADEAAARTALGWATIIDRARFSATRGGRPFEFVAGPSLERFGKARGLASGPGGALLALIPGDAVVVSAPATEGAQSTQPAAGAVALTTDRWGRLWVGGGANVSGPAGVVALTLAERVNLVAMAPSGARAVWVADERGRRVFRFEIGPGVTATARLGERPQPIALAPDGQGGAWALDARNRVLVDITLDGSVKVTTPLGVVAAEPVGLATDELGNVYVLDAKAPAVLVFSVGGRLIVRQPLPQEGESAVSRPTLLAVNHQGEVAVYDARRKKVTWLR